MTEQQQAIAEGIKVLTAHSGETFLFGTVSFVAWPVAAPTSIETDLTATVRAGFFFETTSPVALSMNQVVERDGKRHTVTQVLPRDPLSGRFRFAIGKALE